MNKDSFNSLSIKSFSSSLIGFIMVFSAPIGVTDYLINDLNWEYNYFFPLGGMLVLTGFILGLTSYEKIKRSGEMGKSLSIVAIASLPLSIILFLLSGL